MQIGLNIDRWDSDVEAALMAIQPSLMVVANPDWGTLERCRAAFSVVIIYRYMTPDNYDNIGVDPEVLAQSTWEAVKDHLNVVDMVQGYNEVITTNNIAQQIILEHSFVQLMQNNYHVPVVALNAAVGEIEAENIPLLIPTWKEASRIGYHAYLRPDATNIDPPEWPWHLRRPELIWEPELKKHGLDISKVIFTETGTYNSPFPGLTPEMYAELLISIQDYARSVGVAATAGFTLAAFPPFGQGGNELFEIVGTGAVSALATYLRKTTVVVDNSPSSAQSGDKEMAAFVAGILAEVERLKLLGIDVGDPLADEHPLKDSPDGSEVVAIQATTNGIMFYDAPGNVVHFLKGEGH